MAQRTGSPIGPFNRALSCSITSRPRRLPFCLASLPVVVSALLPGLRRCFRRSLLRRDPNYSLRFPSNRYLAPRSPGRVSLPLGVSQAEQEASAWREVHR